MDSRASKTRACVKITPREKRRYAAGREKNEGLQTKPKLLTLVTADWFWNVKFVSRSKSIKRIQWDSFSHWAVIALVIGKVQGIFIASERKPRHKFSSRLHFSLSPPRVAFSRVGWFSRALAFRSPYYPWGKLWGLFVVYLVQSMGSDFEAEI